MSVGKNVKNITVNVKNPLDELRAQEAAMQQQEELEEEENMPEQDLDPLVLDNDGSVVPASQASWTENRVRCCRSSGCIRGTGG